MNRKKLLLLLLFVIVGIITISGCNTVKGAAEGAKKDWDAVKVSDECIKKTLW